MPFSEEEQRRDLLEKIRAFGDEHGLFTIDLARIARGVGASESLLRDFFESEEGLVADLIGASRVAQRAHLVQSENDDALSLSDRRTREWEGQKKLKAELQLYFEAYWAARDKRSDFMHGMQDWLDFISAGMQRRGVPPDRVAPLATLVMAVFRGALFDFLGTGDEERLKAAIELWAEAEAYLAKPGV
jgi:hypothetical protein